MQITRRAFLATLGALALTGCGGEAPAEETAAEPAAEPSAHVFDGSVASAEYRGTQDAGGNAVVTFAVTNNSD